MEVIQAGPCRASVTRCGCATPRSTTRRIVYVAHYVTYFDHGIHEFFRALPYDYTAIRRTSGTDFHTVRTLVEYRRPLRFDERLRGRGPASRRVGNSSLTFALAALAERRARAARHGRDGLGPRRSGDAARGPLPDALRALLPAPPQP